MTQVKICGLTRPQDVALACELGASAVGFVFAAGSARRVTLEQASVLSSAASPGVARVGVFVDEDAAFRQAAVEAASLDIVQIHRPLLAEDLEESRVPIVAVVNVAQDAAPLPARELLSRCRWVLFDAAAFGSRGGTGSRFDWDLIAGQDFPVPLFLAGGLDGDNVSEAIARVRPSGVDVASGVEKAPGVKDPARMKEFFAAVAQADRSSPFPAQGESG